MKLTILTALLVAFSLNLKAQEAKSENDPQPGHAVGNGIQVNPALSTMNLEDPIAGIDYPTDTDAPKNLKVLVLEKARVRIFNSEETKLEKAQAGIDYPTDTVAPYWTKYAKVLELNQVNRFAVNLSLSEDPLVGQILSWTMPSGIVVDVTEIAYIEKANAGTDYPTDSPGNYYVMVLIGGSRIPMY